MWGGAFVFIFSSLFSLAVNKEALVVDVWDLVGEEGVVPYFQYTFQ